jgi:hypothetical protein
MGERRIPDQRCCGRRGLRARLLRRCTSGALAAVQVDPVCPGRYGVDWPGEREELLARHLAATEQIDGGIDLLLWGGELATRRARRAAAQLRRTATCAVRGVARAPMARHHRRRRPARPGRHGPRHHPGRARSALPTLGTVSSWEVTFSRLVRDTGRRGQPSEREPRRQRWTSHRHVPNAARTTRTDVTDMPASLVTAPSATRSISTQRPLAARSIQESRRLDSATRVISRASWSWRRARCSLR